MNVSASRRQHEAGTNLFLRNVLSNWGGLGANLAVAFFMAPYSVHKLGEVQYGIWALVLQLTGYMGVFDVGIRSALVRFVARALAQDERESLDRTLSTTFLLYCGLALVVLLVGAAALLLALPSLKIPAEFFPAARQTFILGTITLAVGFPLGMFQAVLSGASRFDLNNGVALVTLTLRTAIVLYLLSTGHGVVALAAAHLLTSVAGWLLGFAVARRLLYFRLRLGDATASMLKPILEHSWNSMLISIANRINYQIDTVVISIFLPVSFVTVYVIGYELVRYFRELLNSAAQVIAPIAGGLDARNENDRLTSLVLHGGKFATLFGYFGATMLIFVGPSFIGVWMGMQYIDTSGWVLRLVAFSLYASSTAYMPSHTLFGLGKHRVNVWCTFVEGVLNLGLSLYLVRKVGIYGVAAGTLVGAVLVRGILFPIAYLRVLKIPAERFFSTTVLRCAVPTLVLAASLYGINQWVAIQSYLRLLLVSLTGTAVFLCSTWFLSLDTDERRRLQALAAGWRK